MARSEVKKLERLMLDWNISSTTLINHFFTTCPVKERSDFVEAYDGLGKTGKLRAEYLDEVLYEPSLRKEAVKIALSLKERKKYSFSALKVLAFHGETIPDPSKKVVELVSSHLDKQIKHHLTLPKPKDDSEDLADSLNFVLIGLQAATPIRNASSIKAQIQALSKEKKAHSLLKKIAKRILRGDVQWVREASGQ